MASNKTVTSKKGTKSKYPKASNQPNISAKDLEKSPMPSLENVLESEYGKELQLSDGSVIKASKNDEEEAIELYFTDGTMKVEYRGIEKKVQAYRLTGFTLRSGFIETHRYGRVDDTAKTLLETSTTYIRPVIEKALSSEEILPENGEELTIGQRNILATRERLRAPIKQVQAILGEYKESLKEFELKQIREYK